MRARGVVGVAVASSAVTFLTLGFWGLWDNVKERKQRQVVGVSTTIPGGSCKPDCACQCNQTMCGCR